MIQKIQIAPATLNVIVKWRNHLQYIKIEEFAFRLVTITNVIKRVESLAEMDLIRDTRGFVLARIEKRYF